MIPIPVGWSVHRGTDEMLVVHPDGLGAGAVRYRERVTPLAPITRLAADAVPDGFEVDGVIEPERLTTAEGEYGAVVSIAGTTGGAPAQLQLGFVFGDHSFSRLASLCVDPARFEASLAHIRELAIADVGLRGHRPRRSYYEPPKGWFGVARGLVTEWYPPRFPRSRSMITVWPAMPRSLLTPGWWSSALERSGFVRAGVESIAGPDGLSGTLHRGIRNGEVERLVASLNDPAYAHLCRLEAALDDRESRAAFDSLIKSIEPIPAGRTDAQQLAPAFAHWSS